MQHAQMARRKRLARLVSGIGSLLVGLALLAFALGRGGQATAAPGGSGASGPAAVATLPTPGYDPPRLSKLAFTTSKQGADTKSFSASTDNMLYIHMGWTQISGRHDAY